MSESSEARPLEGRCIVLTGASGGLGRMLAPALAAAGARLGLVSRHRDPLEEVAANLPSHAVLVLPGDTTSEDDNEAAAAAVVARWGRLDVWIANAGICPAVGSALQLTADQFRQVVDVNLTGSFLGARAAAGVMRAGGRIIMTSSVLGQRPRQGFAHYVASKAGLEGLVRALALELAPSDITVNAVAPGWFDSPLAEPWMASGKRSAEILGHVPMGRWGERDDLVGAFVFLASPESRFVTGSVLPVDGGYLLP